MLSTLNLVIVLGVFCIVILVVWFLFADTSVQKKKRRIRIYHEPDRKDWKGLSHKLEKHIYSLRHEVEKLKNEQESFLNEIVLEKAKNEKLKEDLKPKEPEVKEEKLEETKVEEKQEEKPAEENTKPETKEEVEEESKTEETKEAQQIESTKKNKQEENKTE